MENPEINRRNIVIEKFPLNAMLKALEDDDTIFTATEYDSEKMAHYLVAVCAKLEEMRKAGHDKATGSFFAFTREFFEKAAIKHYKYRQYEAPIIYIAHDLKQLVLGKNNTEYDFGEDTFLSCLCCQINQEILNLLVEHLKADELKWDAPAYELKKLLFGEVVNRKSHCVGLADRLKAIGIGHKGKPVEWLRKTLFYYFQILDFSNEEPKFERDESEAIRWRVRGDMAGFGVLRQALAAEIAGLMKTSGGNSKTFDLIAEAVNRHSYKPKVAADFWSEPVILQILEEMVAETSEDVAQKNREMIMKTVKQSLRAQNINSPTLGKAIFELFWRLYKETSPETLRGGLKKLFTSRVLWPINMYWKTAHGFAEASKVLDYARRNLPNNYDLVFKLGWHAPPSVQGKIKEDLRQLQNGWWQEQKTAFLIWRWESSWKWNEWRRWHKEG